MVRNGGKKPFYDVLLERLMVVGRTQTESPEPRAQGLLSFSCTGLDGAAGLNPTESLGASAPAPCCSTSPLDFQSPESLRNQCLGGPPLASNFLVLNMGQMGAGQQGCYLSSN